MDVDATFRAAVLEALDESGLTMAEFARKAGVSYDVIRDLKRREGSTTSAENAKKISKAFNLHNKPFGFKEGGGAFVRGRQIAAALDKIDEAKENPQVQAPREPISFKIENGLVEVRAIVDSQGIDDLIRRLELIKQILSQ